RPFVCTAASPENVQSASRPAATREERSMKIDRSRRTFRVLAAVAATSALLAACSSQGGAPSSGGSGGGSGGGDTSGSNLTFQMITHEQAGDTFWDKIRAGAQDAAKAHGITLNYSNNENRPEQATLVQNAI